MPTSERDIDSGKLSVLRMNRPFHPFGRATEFLPIDLRTAWKGDNFDKVLISRFKLKGVEGSIYLYTDAEAVLNPNVNTPLGRIAAYATNENGNSTVGELPLEFHHEFDVIDDAQTAKLLPLAMRISMGDQTFYQECVEDKNASFRQNFTNMDEHRRSLNDGQLLNEQGRWEYIVLPQDLNKLKKIKVTFISKDTLPPDLTAKLT